MDRELGYGIWEQFPARPRASERWKKNFPSLEAGNRWETPEAPNRSPLTLASVRALCPRDELLCATTGLRRGDQVTLAPFSPSRRRARLGSPPLRPPVRTRDRAGPLSAVPPLQTLDGAGGMGLAGGMGRTSGWGGRLDGEAGGMGSALSQPVVSPSLRVLYIGTDTLGINFFCSLQVVDLDTSS